jgi:glycosyltransferase involved in cell wall biosynthesis
MSNKKISCIITCFNLEKYLDECVDSVKQQIVQPHEIILIHDGCKENCKAYTGVTTVFADKNMGVSKARDMGFKISTGDYIIFLDGDDVLPLNYLMQMAYTDADVVYPNCVVWAGWDNSGLENIWHEAPVKITMEQMLIKNEVLMPSLFKREWYIKCGGFDQSLPLFEDWEYFLNCLSKGATFKKSCAFLMYRQRTLSRNHQSDELKKEVYKKVSEKYKNITLNKKKNSKV